MKDLNIQKISKQVKQIWKKEYFLEKVPELLTMDSSIVNKIKSLYSPGPNFFVIFNFQKYEFEYVEPSVEEVLGYESSTFNIEKMISIIHPEDLQYVPIVEQMAADFMHKEIPIEKRRLYKVSYDSRVFHSNGKIVNLLKQAMAFDLDKNGMVSRVINVMTDISHLNKPNDHHVSFIGLEGEPSYMAIEPDPALVKKFIGKEPISSREKEVLELLAQGLNTDEIAMELFISNETVKSHRKNLLSKLNKKNVAELIAYSIRKGVI